MSGITQHFILYSKPAAESAAKLKAATIFSAAEMNREIKIVSKEIEIKVFGNKVLGAGFNNPADGGFEAVLSIPGFIAARGAAQFIFNID